MDRHIEVIGVDHGWSGMKTVSQVFTTGVKEITTEPAFYNNVVEFNGSYYKVGGKRIEVRDLKVENDNFYILTLAAVAKELNRRGMRNANILLSVGLPLTRFGAEKQDFIDYLSKEKEETFRFDNEQYSIKLARVSVFPQCYAAVADRMKTLPKRVVVVDIGSWTIDIMPIEDSAPNEAECITIREGLIKCMRTINEECMRQYGKCKNGETTHLGEFKGFDVCNPITSEFRVALYDDILALYGEMEQSGKTEVSREADSQEEPEFRVAVTPFEREGSNIRGLARIYFEDSFVVSNVSIIQGKEKKFVAMPSYMVKQNGGKSQYQDVCFPVTKEFREKLYDALMDCYQQERDKAMNQGMEQATSQSMERAEMRQPDRNLPFR